MHGSWPLDSHRCRRVVRRGAVEIDRYPERDALCADKRDPKRKTMPSILSDPCCLMFLVVGGIWLVSLLWQRLFGAKK